MWFIYSFIGILVISIILSKIKSRFSDPYRHVYFIMGKPGSGKSTYFTHEILKYTKLNNKIRKKGGLEWSIYSDSPINIPGVRVFNPYDLGKYWPDKKSIIFIDEIGNYFDSRNFKAFDLKISEFFRLHRHAECIIVVGSQSFDCDLRIRSMVNHFLVVNNWSGIFCLTRPVNIIFPRFTSADSAHGSDIVSEYRVSSLFSWRLFYMPKCFKYFNTKSLPFRPPMPYKMIPCEFLQDFVLDKSKITYNFMEIKQI